jgi:hypothetical protein
MRNKRIVVTTLFVVAAAAILYFLLKKAASSDEEAPIIVKNGSMDVIAGDDPPHNKHWKWVDVGGSNDQLFSHDPNQPHSSKNPGPLYVYVIGTPTSGCTSLTAGDTVVVAYSDDFFVTLSRVQHGSSNNYFTHVEGNRAELKPVNGAQMPTLRHDASAGGGYVTSVKVGTAAPCQFANANALTRLCVSPDNPTDACKDWAPTK